MEILKCLKFPPLNFVLWACIDKREHAQMTVTTLTTITEGVVQGVYKVVTWSSIGVTWRHKVSGGKWTFCHCVTKRSLLNLGC